VHANSARSESKSEHPSRPSLLRTALSVTAGIGTLLVGLGLAVRPGLSPAAQLVLGICGFAGYIALVGPALDRRYRLDRQWRQDPPDLSAFRDRKATREKSGPREPGSSGMPLAIATLVLGVTLYGDAAAAAGARPAGTDAEGPPSTAHGRSFGDLVFAWRATPSLTVTGDLDAGSQNRPGLEAATWWGAFVSARAALTQKSAIAVRAERFSDPDAGISGFTQKLWGVTGTPEHRPYPRLILKLEARYDRSTEPLFDGSVPGGGKEGESLAVLGAVATFGG